LISANISGASPRELVGRSVKPVNGISSTDADVVVLFIFLAKYSKIDPAHRFDAIIVLNLNY
jgi:hypothetical protein